MFLVGYTLEHTHGFIAAQIQDGGQSGNFWLGFLQILTDICGLLDIDKEVVYKCLKRWKWDKSS